MGNEHRKRATNGREETRRIRLSNIFIRFVTTTVSAFAMVFWGVGLAQEAETKWLVGMWEGEQTRPAATESSKVTVEFRQEGQAIRWELSVTAFGREGKARGSAKVQGDAVTMEGQYYAGRFWGYLSYSLTRSGDLLEGTGIGAANVPFNVSWKKVK